MAGGAEHADDDPPRSIGGYSAGCIDGAVALPKVGDGFRVAKPERNRVFGHPLLVGLIRNLGKQLVALKAAPLSVGNLGQPRGGPAPTGHASHQTGLDVDLWFLPPVAGSAVSMVNHAKMQPSPKFTATVMRLLAMTAADARVERIFVNPVLKRAMCERPGDAGSRVAAQAAPVVGARQSLPREARLSRRQPRVHGADAAAAGRRLRRTRLVVRHRGRRPIARRATRPTRPRSAPRRRCPRVAR